MNESIDTSLTRSIATQSLADVLGTVSETALDAALEQGVLRDIPIVGTLIGLLKAGSDIRSVLFLRKVALFLKTLAKASDAEREAFVKEMQSRQRENQLGQTILLLLDRAADMEKPILIAQIIVALIKRRIEYPIALRICAMIDRCYVQDLNLLRHFTPGAQGRNTPIAETLQSVGFLSNGGFDGGTASDPDSGGVVYYLNEYGKLFVEHALTHG